MKAVTKTFVAMRPNDVLCDKSATGTLPDIAGTRTKSLTASAIYIALGRLFAVGGLIVFESLLASRLTAEDFGRYLIYFSAATAVAMLFSLGIHRALPRSLKQHLPKGEFGPAFASLGNAAWVLSFVFTGLLVILSATVSLLPDNLLLVVVPLSAGLALQQILAETLRAIDKVAMASLYAGPAGGPLFVAAALFILTLPPAMTGDVARILQFQCVFAWLLLVPGLFALGSAFRSISASAPRNSANFHLRRPARSVMADYLSLMLAQVAFYACTQVDLWIAPLLMDELQVATYASPRRLVMLTSAPLQLINMLVVTQIPELLSLNRPHALQTLLRKTALLGFLPSGMLLVVFVCFPEHILSAIYGDNYVEGAAVLRILAVAQMFNAWTGSCGLTLMMSGRQRAALFINIASAGSLFAFVHIAAVDTPIKLASLAAIVIMMQYSSLWLFTWRFVGVRTDAGCGSVAFTRLKTNVSK